MVNWPEAWEKLLDKRVDIVANALSGLIAGITALLPWALTNWLKKRTARKRLDKIRARRRRLAVKAESLANDSRKAIAFLAEVDSFWAEISPGPEASKRRAAFMEKWHREFNSGFVITADSTKALAEEIEAIRIPGEEELFS